MFYLGECLVSWLREKQSSIYLSKTEAEYIAEAYVVHRFFG
jgi:hypothetical protein